MLIYLFVLPVVHLPRTLTNALLILFPNSLLYYMNALRVQNPRHNKV